jgi:hypothetical protein
LPLLLPLLPLQAAAPAVRVKAASMAAARRILRMACLFIVLKPTFPVNPTRLLEIPVHRPVPDCPGPDADPYVPGTLSRIGQQIDR